ncbi:MAG TPA: hypothetical protein DCL38_07425 [Lachnospiraceae bacterium]|nr:hypothetical protein [Lachnospiraceae bacterium]
MAVTYYDTEQIYEQPSTEKLKENAGQTLKKALDKGKKLNPVIVKGNKIADSWWGRAWCENLERYADYESRLERGKRYLRTGTVVDLQIKKGVVSAKVQGRRKNPYKVEIRISPISEGNLQRIMGVCGKRVESMDMLLKGQFPEDLRETFIGEGGLFPTPKEISFNCSCPDWALMCKHVSAVLYGIGVRFDEDPLLFFKLRGIEVEHFVDVTLENSVESMLRNVDVKSDRIITGSSWKKLFQ